MTAIGPIDLRRWHSRCPGCADVGFAADALLGLDGWLTPRARRMVIRAGLNDPFRQAEQLLAELAGWSVDAETVRRCTHAEASEAAAARAERTALPETFARAEGEHEVHLDDSISHERSQPTPCSECGLSPKLAWVVYSRPFQRKRR